MRSVQWREKSRWVRSLTRHRCVLFPWLRARQTHHLTYFLLPGVGWNWWGFEQPCWHLIPLSITAHNLVGTRILWRQPLRFFVNLYLRLAFLFWWSLFNPLFSIPFWIFAYFLATHFLNQEVVALTSRLGSKVALIVRNPQEIFKLLGKLGL